MKHKASIMAHCVAYFPDEERSMAAARGLIRGGAEFIEVQLPFSDPMADGPAIQSACQSALESGFTVDKGLQWTAELAAASPVPVFIMSYGNLLFRRGIERFCREAAEAGAAGLIVPDLLPPQDEGLYAACREAGMAAVPVISPGISDKRLATIAAERPKYLYTTLRSGITGSRTEVRSEQLQHLQCCRATGANVLAGFGIDSREQVEALGPHVDTLVVGSHFVKALIGLDGAATPEECDQVLQTSIENLRRRTF